MNRDQLKRREELETENQRLKRVVADLSLDKMIFSEAARGIPLTGRLCRTLGQHRSTQRKVPRGLPDKERLTADIIALTKEFGRYASPG